MAMRVGRKVDGKVLVLENEALELYNTIQWLKGFAAGNPHIDIPNANLLNNVYLAVTEKPF